MSPRCQFHASTTTKTAIICIFRPVATDARPLFSNGSLRRHGSPETPSLLPLSRVLAAGNVILIKYGHVCIEHLCSHLTFIPCVCSSVACIHGMNVVAGSAKTVVGGDGDYFRSVEQWRLNVILTKTKNANYGRFCGCRSVKLTAKTQIKWSSALKQFKVPKSVQGVLNNIGHNPWILPQSQPIAM